VRISLENDEEVAGAMPKVKELQREGASLTPNLSY